MDPNDSQISEEAKSDGKGKKTFVLGVVDTSSMKSAIANRKRRWDQPPEETDEAVPPPKMAITNDPVDELNPNDPAEEVQLNIDNAASAVELADVEETSVDSKAMPALADEAANSVSAGSNEDHVKEINSATSDIEVHEEDKCKAESSKPPDVENTGENTLEAPSIINKKPDANDARKKADDKPILAVPVKVSDSLKAILCYDEGSNSSEDSYQDASSEMVEIDEKVDALPIKAEATTESETSQSIAAVESAKDRTVPEKCIVEAIPESVSKQEPKDVISEPGAQLKGWNLPVQDAVIDSGSPERCVPALESASDAGKDQYEADNSDLIQNPADESAEKPSGISKADGNFSRSNLVSMDNSQNCTDFDDIGEKGSSKSPDLDLTYSDSEGDGEKQANETMHFASLRHDTEKNVEEAKDESASNDASLPKNSEVDENSLEFNQQSHSNTMEMLDSLVRRSSMESSSQRVGEDLFSEDSLINEINLLPDKDEDKKGKVPATLSQDAEVDSVCKKSSNKADTASDPPKDIGTSISSRAAEPVDAKNDKSESRASAEEDLSQGPDEDSRSVAVSSANIMEVIFGEQETCEFPTINSEETESEKGDVKEDVEVTSENAAEDSKLQLMNDEIEMDGAEIVAVDPTEPLSGEDSEHEMDEKPALNEKVEGVTEVANESKPPGERKRKVSETEEEKQSKKVTTETKTVPPRSNVIEATTATKMDVGKVDELQVTKSVTHEPLVDGKEGLDVTLEPHISKGKDQLSRLPSVNQTGTKEQQDTQVPTEAQITSEAVKKTTKVPEVASVVTQSVKSAPEVAKDPQKDVKPLKVTITQSARGPQMASEVAKDAAKSAWAVQRKAEIEDEDPTKSHTVTTQPAKYSGKESPRLTKTPESIDVPKSPIVVQSAKKVAVEKPDQVSIPQKVVEVTQGVAKPPKAAHKLLAGSQTVHDAAKIPPTHTKPAHNSGFGHQVADEVGKQEFVKEPVPVLIIKKQALSSKKDGEVIETLLTCSPKAESIADSPARKLQSELYVDTHDSVEPESSKNSPITMRIYKDNLTVKTDLDSPKRTRSPSSGEFKSELSPHIKSPGVSDSLSPQNKPLEFTLKIAKDANTNIPKATMSPKRVASPTSVWKSEVQMPESVMALPVEEVSTPKPSRGRGRGRGRPPWRGRGRGAVTKGMEQVRDAMAQQEDPQGVHMSEQLKKMMSANAVSSTQALQLTPVPSPMPNTPVSTGPKKRGRPRKSTLEVNLVHQDLGIKQEPGEPPSEDTEAELDTPTSGRPKRTCRGRTKPIVVKKRKPRGGGVVGGGIPRGSSTPLPVPVSEIKQEPSTPQPPPETTVVAAVTPDATPIATLPPVPVETPVADVTTSPPSDKSAAATPSTPVRGRGGFKRPTPDRNTLSEKELAEIQKIEARKEKLRLDRIAKYEAKKAKKLAKKLKDEERRKRIAREKAEAAAPQVFEEETRMSAPDSSSRGHTPAPNRVGQTGDGIGDESQNSISTPGDTNKGNKKGRMEISITDLDCLVKEVRVDDLAEYQWQGSELFMIQEQVSLYLGVKSFKRKYPGLKRRTVEAEERTFLEDSGLVPKSMCDLGLTAVSSAEILDIMYHDFPDKYEEFRKHVRDKQAREASFKQKAAIGLQRKDGMKVEPREQALEAVAAWNANLNRERREERRCALDLQTFTVHYPKLERDHKMKKTTPKLGLYPVAVIPGQYCDYYKKYTPNELMYFPVNTVVYGPLKPNERHRVSMDGSASDSSSSSSSSSSSGDSSSDSESEGEEPPRCSMCSGTKKKNKEGLAEILLLCAICKTHYHPACKDFTPEMTPHLSKYDWQCTACKKCTKCKDASIKDRIMSCQLCDRGYHLACIGLKKMPEGRWHCTVCAYCSSCGSRNPGGSDWQHEFKKGDRGVKIYQRTLCTPCFKLWRKGKYCQLCSKCHVMRPEEDANMIQCNSCDRWLHKECYGSKYGIQTKLLTASSIQCDLCVERLTQSTGTPGVHRPLIKL